MARRTVDVKILAAPGAAQVKTAKHVWSAVAQAGQRVAVEQLLSPRTTPFSAPPACPR